MDIFGKILQEIEDSIDDAENVLKKIFPKVSNPEDKVSKSIPEVTPEQPK